MSKLFGKVPEWLNGTFSKNVVPLKSTEGSNPSFSAIKNKNKKLQEVLKLSALTLEKNRHWLVSIIISILTVFFFLTINSPDLFLQFQFFNQRWLGLAILSISLAFIWVTSQTKFWSRWRSFSIWFQASCLLIFSFIYYIRLNQSQLDVVGLNLNTNVIFIPLTVLIFVVVYQLYKFPNLSRILLLSTVGLYFLQTYSIISFILFDRTGLRFFSQDWINKIFEVNPVFLILVASLIIGLITTINLNIQEVKTKYIATIIFSTIIFSTTLAIQGLPFTYWYKLLLSLVLWDFMFRPFQQVFEGLSDPKFLDKVVVSSIYHGILTIIIIGTALIVL